MLVARKTVHFGGVMIHGRIEVGDTRLGFAHSDGLHNRSINKSKPARDLAT